MSARECPPGTHSMFDFCPGDCDKPVTAREILEGYGLPDGVVDEALMAHAHELAEQIRAPHPPKSYHPYSDSFEGGADWAADLIDPEVS